MRTLLVLSTLLSVWLNTALADFKCTEVGTFADPSACANFIECVEGATDGLFVKYVKTCAEGTLFDDDTLVWRIVSCLG